MNYNNQEINLPLANSNNSLWKNISDTLFSSAIVVGGFIGLIQYHHQHNEKAWQNVEDYYPYFLLSSFGFSFINLTGDSLIKPIIQKAASFFLDDEDINSNLTDVGYHVINTFVASAMVISSCKMFDAFDKTADSLYKIFAQSFAIGALPALTRKLAVGDIDHVSFDLSVSFLNQFVRKGIKISLDNLKNDYQLLPNGIESNIAAAAAGSITKGLLLHKDGLDICKSFSFNTLNTLVYDAVDVNKLLREKINDLLVNTLTNQIEEGDYTFISSIIATTITESSEKYVDSLAMYGVEKIFDNDDI